MREPPAERKETMTTVRKPDALVKSGGVLLPASPLEKVEDLREKIASLEQSVNMVTPVSSIDMIPKMHAISLRAVTVDSTTNKYGQGPEVYRDARFCEEGEVALGGVALQKIMAAAGVQIIGRQRLDDRKDPYYCNMEITLAVRDYDGTLRQFVAGKEVDLRDGAPETMKPEKIKRGERWEKTDKMVPKSATAVADMRRHIQSIAETKALYRALRKILQIKQKYTREELRRPFVVPKLVPNLDPNDPDQKQALIAMATGAEQRLFGPPKVHPDDRLLRDVTPNEAPHDAVRPIDVSPVSPPLEPEPEPEPEEVDPDDFEMVEVPKEEIHICTCPCGCQSQIKPETAAVTTERVGAPRCKSCFPGKGFDYNKHEDVLSLELPKAPRLTPAMIRDQNAARKAGGK